MNDKIYVVYTWFDDYISDYGDDQCRQYCVEKYFTDEDKAEKYAKYLTGSRNGSYSVDEVECGDNIDVDLLIREFEEMQRVKMLAKEKERRAEIVESLAKYQSCVTGEDYIDLLNKLREQYMDYVLNGN